MDELTEISHEVDTQIDALVQDIVRITSEILEQHAEDKGEESLKVIRVA